MQAVPVVLAMCTGAALAAPQEGLPADEPVATVELRVPWEPGMTLVYATESVDVDQGPALNRRIVARDTTTIGMRKDADGAWLQSWTSRDAGAELLVGEDDGTLAGMLAAAEAFDGVPLVVRLGPDAGYAGIEDLEDVAASLREALRPVMVAGLEKAMAGRPDSEGSADADAHREARGAAMARLDSVLASMTAPAVVETMLRRAPENFNAFTGLELEPGATYEAEAELDNPLGDTAIPARLEFVAYEPESHPGHLLLEWSSTIDPERGAQAAWEAAQQMLGMEFPPDARVGLPAQITVADAGFVLVDAAGVPEMFESERSVLVGDRRSFDRQRMRLHNDHAHAWAEDDAATWLPVPAPAQ